MKKALWDLRAFMPSWLAHSRAPLSYRSIDENEYREAMLVFYELNSILPFKEIFISQYVFAAKHYGVK